MFDEIENDLIAILQKNVGEVPKENISAKMSDLNIEKNLPAIYIRNIDFKIEEVGIGRVASTKSNEVKEYFNGDGEKVNYILSKKPLKPILLVEHPLGRRRTENVDYVVDYKTGLIIFKFPPEEGSNNILVKYLVPVETKSVKLNMKYYISVWSRDEAQVNRILFSIIKTFLKEGERLISKGILIKPVRGFSIPAEDLPEGVYGKTIECLLETYLQVEIQLSRIEKIEIGGKRI